MTTIFDVVIIGAGPSGLSCAIEASKVGLSNVVLEQGSVVDAIRRFPTNMTWFSTPELLEIGGVPFVIPTMRPSRVDTLNYYQRVAQHHRLDVRQMDRVTSIARTHDGFTVATGRGQTYSGRTLVVATGYFDRPNRLGVAGEDRADVAHYYDEPFRHFDRDVVVVGGSNSAVEAALDLFRHRARVTLVHRGERVSDRVKYWVVPDIENRIKKGEIRALFRSTVQEICDKRVVVETPDGVEALRADFTYVLVGFAPDTRLISSCGVTIRPDTLAPVLDETTFETDVPGLFVAGSIVAGKDNNKIFVENGRLHASVIIPAITARIR